MLKKQERKRNKYHSTALILFIIALIIFLFSIFLNRNIVLEKGEIDTSLQIFYKTGFDLNKTVLNFGNIVPGSSSSKNFLMDNGYDFPIIMTIKVKGDIGRFLYFDKEVLIEKGETKQIGVSAVIPANETYGNYSGKVIYTIKKHI